MAEATTHVSQMTRMRNAREIAEARAPGAHALLRSQLGASLDAIVAELDARIAGEHRKLDQLSRILSVYARWAEAETRLEIEALEDERDAIIARLEPAL
jgi:hypothetical protein